MKALLNDQKLALVYQVGNISGFLELLSSYLFLVVIGSSVILFVLLGLFMFIKIVQGNNVQKSTINSLQNDNHSKNQASTKNLFSILNYLHQMQSTLVIYHSLYKQLLYLKTKTYHGTSMTSIFVSLKKQQQSDSSNQDSIFQERSLGKLRQQIIYQVRILIKTFQEIIQLFESTKISISNQKNIDFNISDLLKYNLPNRQVFSQLEDKISELSKNLKNINQKHDDQQFIELIKNSIYLISKFSSFLKHIQKSYLKDISEQQYQEKSLSKLCQKQEKVHSIVNNICRQDEILQNHDFGRKYSKVSQKISMQIEEFIRNRVFEFNHENNFLEFLNKEISDLSTLQQLIKKNKFTLQQKKEFDQDIENQIKIYSTANNQHQQHYFSQSDKNLKSQTKQTIVEKTQTAFSSQSKLNFIKQLDKLMIRNKIRKELEQIQQKMKLQKNLQQMQENEIISDSNIILQKI